MRFLLLSLIISFNSMANSLYNYELIVNTNAGIIKRLDFLKDIGPKNQVILAVIGDYIHTDVFEDIIAINHSEIANNLIDDDNNGYVDDYYGVNLNSGDGRLDSPVITGHENAIVSLLHALIQNNNLQNSIKVLPLNITSNVKGFDPLYMKKLADAIDYARIRGAKVITMSLGVSKNYSAFFKFINSDYHQSLAYYNAAIKRAIDDGILLVGANSNNPERDQVEDPFLPASSDGVISVANVNYEGKIQSAYGKNVDVAFYGTNIYVWEGVVEGYKFVKGASFSAPVVAFVAAVAKSLKPDLSYGDISLLRNSCERPIQEVRNIASKCIFSPVKFIQKIYQKN